MRILFSVKGITDSIIGGLIILAVLPVLAAVWALLKSSWTVALEVFLGSFLFLAAVVNQLTDYLERIRRARRNRASPAEIKGQIRDWLYEMRYSLQDAPEAKFNFVFSCIDFQNTRFYVFQNDNMPSTVSIMTPIDITLEEHKKFLNGTPEVLSNMRMEMARLGVAYAGIAAPVSKFSARIDLPWSEYFTAYVLQQAISYVSRARAIMVEVIFQAFSKAGVSFGAPSQPQLPKTDGQTKPPH